MILRIFMPLAVVLAGWIGYSFLSVESEEAKGLPTKKKRELKTKVVELRMQDYATTVRTQGAIRPHNQVTLTSRVPGRVIRLFPEFEDGAFFAQGDVMVELDRADYQSAVIAAEAQVARAAAAHDQETARAKQAKLNWEDLGYDEEPNDLVLRLPQLREAKANLDSAEEQLVRAKRDLEFTKVRAPFDGRVHQRSVGLAQSVGNATSLGIIYATDFAEVRLPISARDMEFLALPEGPKDAPVEVELRDALNTKNKTVWKATILRTEGALDRDSLELFAIARVIDPFGIKSGKSTLRIGQPVIGTVPGRVLEDVFALPRVAVRQLDQIILVAQQELTLDMRTITPIWSDQEYVVFRDSTIENGSWVATTHMVYVPNGAKVEILPDVNTNTTVQSKSPLKEKNPG